MKKKIRAIFPLFIAWEKVFDSISSSALHCLATIYVKIHLEAIYHSVYELEG